MIEYINAPGAVHRIEQLIDNADRFIVLVSPYLRFGPNIAERLRAADRRGISIGVVYGKERQLHPEVEDDLQSLAKLKLRYYENLHGKCYLSEKGMVITSMNLYEFSQRNREMGIYVTRDKEVYNDAFRDVKQLLENAEHVSLHKPKSGVVQKLMSLVTDPRRHPNHHNVGCCIRCKVGLNHNPYFPLCPECYDIWAIFGNGDYSENYCHSCGRPSHTSYNRPQCRSCYRKYAA